MTGLLQLLARIGARAQALGAGALWYLRAIVAILVAAVMLVPLALTTILAWVAARLAPWPNKPPMINDLVTRWWRRRRAGQQTPAAPATAPTPQAVVDELRRAMAAVEAVPGVAPQVLIVPETFYAPRPSAPPAPPPKRRPSTPAETAMAVASHYEDRVVIMLDAERATFGPLVDTVKRQRH